MDDLDTVGWLIGNDPGSLHKMNQIDLFAILENTDNDNANLHLDVNDYLVDEIEIGLDNGLIEHLPIWVMLMRVLVWPIWAGNDEVFKAWIREWYWYISARKTGKETADEGGQLSGWVNNSWVFAVFLTRSETERGCHATFTILMLCQP